MQAFEQNILNIYGEKGRQWLEDLSKRIMQAEAAYGLSQLKPVKNLSFNYVLSGFQANQPIILKLGLDIDGLKREAATLMAFAGFGAVRVFSENAGLLVLERAVPGVSLKSYFSEKDDDAMNITANLIKRLHKAPIPPAHTFPHIKDWLAALDKDWNIPTEYLQKARQLRDNLLETSAREALLHGDLHHDNILKNGDDWVMIDPKGVLGEPTFEVGAFIRNPIPELLTHNSAPDIINHRIHFFAQVLKVPPQRILEWSLVQAVLAWVWALEDGCDVSYFKNLTSLFDKMVIV